MRLPLSCLLLALVLPSPALAQAKLTPADQAGAFKAAGFKRVGAQWRSCDEGGGDYSPGKIETLRDIDGDGQPDAVIVEGGAACFGIVAQQFSLVSKQAGGGWKLIDAAPGYPRFLPRRTATGWPDIEIGGPGFCFPVWRWSGKEYRVHRFQYEGKPCKP